MKTFRIRERNEHLAKHLSIYLSQNPNTSNAGWIAAILNPARLCKRKPRGHRVKPVELPSKLV